MLVTKNSCPYCQKALELLKKRECSFAYTDMDNALNLLENVKVQADWETVPMIWEQTLQWDDDVAPYTQPVVAENSFVGGYTELVELLDEMNEGNDTEESND